MKDKTKKRQQDLEKRTADVIKAYEASQKFNVVPDHLWHPEFGWLIYEGKVQDGAREFLEEKMK